MKFFKLLLDRVNLLNQLYWYLWSYCKRRVLYIYVCFEFCYLYYYFFFYFKQCVCKQCKDTASFGDSGEGSGEGSGFVFPVLLFIVSGKLAANDSVVGIGITNHTGAPEWSNQTYLTL